MDCNQARELMNSYIDGVLAEAEVVAFEEHISCCENCHEEYDMLKKVSTDLSKTVVPIPDGFAERVHCALVEEKLASEKKSKPIFRYYRFASGLAAALVIAAVGKFGVYDTYKKVTNETVQMGTQTVAENPSDEVVPVEAEDEVPVRENKSAETPIVAKAVEPTNRAIVPVQEESIPAPAAFQADEYANGVAPGAEEPVLAAPMSIEIEETPSLAPRTVMDGAVEEVVVDDADAEEIASSGGTNSKGMLTTDAVIITEPIPANAELNGNDEETMIAVKAFLLTFVEESAIVYEDNTIKVTVSAEDYDNVVRRIGESEYIKSVVHGVPLDGVGIIIIK